mmetsp:Transcript_17441/g.26377  ORF Transcript_17441/g.26377 Transcript_17441/m.26377 type:complete len:102 (-) Transcript_17441:636-941(-)
MLMYYAFHSLLSGIQILKYLVIADYHLFTAPVAHRYETKNVHYASYTIIVYSSFAASPASASSASASSSVVFKPARASAASSAVPSASSLSSPANNFSISF